MRRQRVFLGIGALVLVFGTVIGIGFCDRSSRPVQHGISFTKGCVEPDADRSAVLVHVLDPEHRSTRRRTR